MPTRTSSSTAAETDALNKPVRRSLGNVSRICERSALKLESRSLSASSRTRRSNQCLLIMTLDEFMTSTSRLGVAIKTLGLMSEKVARSSGSFVRPPQSSCGMI